MNAEGAVALIAIGACPRRAGHYVKRAEVFPKKFGTLRIEEID